MPSQRHMASASLRSLFLQNAFANVIGGASAALFTLSLPALAARHLTKLEFSVWTLVLQVIVYVQVFGFGLQTVISYFVARDGATGATSEQRASIRAGLSLAYYFAAAASLLVGLLVAVYPFIFEHVPAALTNEFRASIAVLGLSAAFQIIALVPAGLFFGLHKNSIPVLSQVLVRIVSLCVLWSVISLDASLLVMSIALAACSALLVPANFFAARQWGGRLFQPLAPKNGARVREMFRACGGLAVWNIAMLLVNGVDILLVGHFDFARVAAFSLAATAVTIFAGLLQAVLNPLIAMGSRLHAGHSKHGELEKLLVKTSGYCAAFLVVTIVLFSLVGHDAIRLWAGAHYVGEVQPLLWILLLAQAVRHLMAPYAVLLVAVGLQRRALMPAMIEGGINACASLILVTQMGALGVAYGTLIGAIAGVVASLIMVVGHTKELVSSRKVFLKKIIILPMTCFALLFLWRHT
jgi:O-antigen/teichoic acid export membrane protein